MAAFRPSAALQAEEAGDTAGRLVRHRFTLEAPGGRLLAISMARHLSPSARGQASAMVIAWEWPPTSGSRSPARPHVAGSVTRSFERFASCVVGARLLSRTLPAIDAFTLKVTGGRTTYTEGVAGLPTIYLTTRGAKTGRTRTVPLLAVVAGEDIAVIGSNWGRARHPGWVHNLLAHLRATVTRHDRSLDVIVREATGAEADHIWSTARDLYRGYRTYPARTQDRSIRVFLLEHPPDGGRP